MFVFIINLSQSLFVLGMGKNLNEWLTPIKDLSHFPHFSTVSALTSKKMKYEKCCLYHISSIRSRYIINDDDVMFCISSSVCIMCKDCSESNFLCSNELVGVVTELVS